MIEKLARAHWWHRHKAEFDNEFLHVLEGHESPAIEQAWNKAKETEIQAMQAALGTLTLANIISTAHGRS